MPNRAPSTANNKDAGDSDKNISTAKVDQEDSTTCSSDYSSSPPDPECTGSAAEALSAYREREAFLKRNGQHEPDMVAFKELRSTWTPERQHGQIGGVPVGLKLGGRGQAAILGIHKQMLRGIDAVKDESCFAICVAGKYADDDDDHGSDGTIVYTGEGGQKKGHQVEDQKRSAGNAALIESIDTQLPVRVLRGRQRGHHAPEYYYDGLYKCTGYRYEASAEGPLVYKFTLAPIENESKARSIMVEPIRSPSPSGPRSRLLQKRKREDNDADEQKKRRDSTKPSSDL